MGQDLDLEYGGMATRLRRNGVTPKPRWEDIGSMAWLLLHHLDYPSALPAEPVLKPFLDLVYMGQTASLGIGASIFFFYKLQASLGVTHELAHDGQ